MRDTRSDYDRGYDEGYEEGIGIALGTYTHRNGESDPPTQYGWYWIEDGDRPFIDFLGHRYSDDALEWSSDYTQLSDSAKFYGPIPEPKRG